MRNRSILVRIPCLLFILFVCLTNSVLFSEKVDAILIRVEDYTSLIDTPVQEHIINAFRLAEDKNVPLVIQLDTYGGYLDPALTLAAHLLNSRVPIIIFVKDKAYSAGAIIAMAAHILAMRSTAVIGAAQPITVNPITGQIIFINESKIVNPVVKTLEICANTRNRNISIVKRFVYENLVLTGYEAKELGVADYIVESVDDLMTRLRGVKVNVSGVVWELTLGGYEEIQPSLDIYVKIFLRNPVVNSVLLFIGMFGTLFLLTSGHVELIPMAIIILLLALIGGGIEGRTISIILTILGSILLFIELFVTPGFGVLGVSGVIALIMGILLSPIPTAIHTVSISVIWRIIVIFVIVFGTFFSFILYKIITTARKPRSITYVPKEKAIGVAIDKIHPGKKGYVSIDGELWIAESDEDIEPGDQVEVIKRERLTIKVRKKR